MSAHMGPADAGTLAPDDRVAEIGARLQAAGAGVMLFGLALIFLWFGAMKFTSYEATGIAPLVANSPLVGWWHATFGVQGTSYLLGCIEVATGVLLLAGLVRAILGVAGAAMAVVAFLIILTFLFSTPGVFEPKAGGFPAISAFPGGFLMKDFLLLGISLYLLGRFLRAWRPDATAAVQVGWLAAGVMRYGLVLIFLWFGCMKFTSYEATGVAPLIANSPLVGWWHTLLGIQGASTMLGVIEITTGVLLAARIPWPLLSAAGGAMAAFAFLITLSFFLSTPGVAEPLAGGLPAISAETGQFLLKDIGLLGAAIWLSGEALRGHLRDLPR